MIHTVETNLESPAVKEEHDTSDIEINKSELANSLPVFTNKCLRVILKTHWAKQN